MELLKGLQDIPINQPDILRHLKPILVSETKVLSTQSILSLPFIAAPQPTYDYGYGRPAQTYDTTKTYYQPASASYVAAPSYVDSNVNKATYTQPPTRAPIQQKVPQYSAPSSSEFKH